MTLEYAGYIVGLVLLAIFCLLVVIGIFLNAFIVIVNLTFWMKAQPPQAIDIIITCLAMVRIILLLLYIVSYFGFISDPSLIQMNMSHENISILTMFAQFCSLWWGSVLCVFYCVKITTYKSRLLLRLKMNISKMVPRLLVVLMVPSFVSSLPYKWFVFSFRYVNGTDGPTGVIETNLLNNFIICIAGSIIPFVIFCISIGLVIVSLLRHTRHLGSRGSGFSDAQRDVHLSVIRNMFSFLLFYILYFLGSNLISVSKIYKKHLLTILCSIFYAAFPSLHSISLIVGNRELKNAFLSVFRCSWLRDVDSESS